MNIFVGNLSFETTGDDVKKLFEGFGNVSFSVIVMRKEKKVPKSRGFGFVDMPDEQQALAAIAALNGKEFMGRVLDIAPARPKAETQVRNEVEVNEKRLPKPAFEARQYPRTHSFMNRGGSAGTRERTKPRRSSQYNSLRWRKSKDQAKPWQKSPGEHKPWEKAEGKARPWKKAEGEFKPWRKSEAGAKPWKKTAGDAKPWKKPTGDAKPWKRSNERPQESRFKGRKKPGGYKR